MGDYSFLCQHEKLSGIVCTAIRYVTLHFRDQGGATSLLYRNLGKIIAFVCEQKPYAVWFSRRRRRYPVQYEHLSDM